MKIITKVKYEILIFLLRKEVVDMAMVYSLLIIKELKTFQEVPSTLREQVKECLIALEAEHLIPLGS